MSYIPKIDSSEVPLPPEDTNNNKTKQSVNIFRQTNPNNLNERNIISLGKRKRDPQEDIIDNEAGEPLLKKQKTDNTTKQSPPTSRDSHQQPIFSAKKSLTPTSQNNTLPPPPATPKTTRTPINNTNEKTDKTLSILIQEIDRKQIVWSTNKINNVFNYVTNIIHKSNKRQASLSNAKKARKIRQILFKYMIDKIENEEKPNKKTIALSTTLVTPFSLSLNSEEEKNHVLYIFLQQIVECELEPNAYIHYATTVFPRTTITLMNDKTFFKNKYLLYILKATIESLAKINHSSAKNQICVLTNLLISNIDLTHNSNMTILSLDLLMTSIQNIQTQLNEVKNFLKHNSKKTPPQQSNNIKQQIQNKQTLITHYNQTVLNLLNWYKNHSQKTQDLTTAFIACLTGILGCSNNAIQIFNMIIKISKNLPQQQQNSIYFDNIFAAIRKSTYVKTPEMINQLEQFKINAFKNFTIWKERQANKDYKECTQICNIATQFIRESESFCRFLNIEANFFEENRLDNTFIDAIEETVQEHSGQIAASSSSATNVIIHNQNPFLLTELNEEKIQKGESIRQEITTNMNKISNILTGPPQFFNPSTKHILINMIDQYINAIRKYSLIDLTAATGHDNETILGKIRDIIMLKKRLEQPEKQMVNIYNLNPDKLIINSDIKMDVIAANKKILQSIVTLDKSNHFYTSIITFLSNLITNDSAQETTMDNIYKISNYLAYYTMIKQNNKSELIAKDLFKISHMGKSSEVSGKLEEIVTKIERDATQKEKKESQSYDTIILFNELKTFIFEVIKRTSEQQMANTNKLNDQNSLDMQLYNIHMFGKIFSISNKLQQQIPFPRNQKCEISPVNTIETIIKIMNNEEIIIDHLYNNQHTQNVIKSMMTDFDEKIEIKTNEISNQIDKVENLALEILRQRANQRAQELVLKEKIREILMQSNLLAKTEDVLPQNHYIVPPPPPTIGTNQK